tara:strand:- start:131 stop:841 length:711 start_codon:yes stop_codon:yes gene_type:complete
MTLSIRLKAFSIFFFSFCIQDIYGQAPVEEDQFFNALGQELEFYEADWLENYTTKRDISLGVEWFTESNQEAYLGQIIYSDKKLSRKLRNKGRDKDDIAVLFVVMTNNSRYRILFDGSSANITDSKNQITEGSKIEKVIKKFKYKYNRGGKAFVKIATLGFGGTKGFDEMRLGSIRSNLLNKSLKKTIIEPGESYTGLFFIPVSSIKDDSMIQIPIQNLKRLLYMDLKLNLPANIS